MTTIAAEITLDTTLTSDAEVGHLLTELVELALERRGAPVECSLLDASGEPDSIGDRYRSYTVWIEPADELSPALLTAIRAELIEPLLLRGVELEDLSAED